MCQYFFLYLQHSSRMESEKCGLLFSNQTTPDDFSEGCSCRITLRKKAWQVLFQLLLEENYVINQRLKQQLNQCGFQKTEITCLPVSLPYILIDANKYTTDIILDRDRWTVFSPVQKHRFAFCYHFSPSEMRMLLMSSQITCHIVGIE